MNKAKKRTCVIKLNYQHSHQYYNTKQSWEVSFHLTQCIQTKIEKNFVFCVQNK